MGFSSQLVQCTVQVATALGVESVIVKEAAHSSKAEHGMPLKKTTAAPVPMETVLVPVETAPAVAVSGTDMLPQHHALLSSNQIPSLAALTSVMQSGYTLIYMSMHLFMQKPSQAV